MTQEEQDARLGKTKREYLQARAKLGAIKDRHAELLSRFRELLISLEQEPMRVYVGRGPRGLLQAAMEAQEARYFYTPDLADDLSLEGIGNHLDELRTVFELAEDRRRSLISQGDDDPGPSETAVPISGMGRRHGVPI